MIPIFKILNKSLIYKIYFGIFLSIFVAFIEILSIGSIIPFLYAIINPEKILQHEIILNSKYFNYIEGLINFSDLNLFYILSLSLILIVFSFKTVLINAFDYYNFYLSKIISIFCKNKIFIKYININYNEFISKDQTKIIRDIDSESMHVAGYINTNSLIIKELFQIILLIIILLKFNTELFLYSFVALSFVAFIYSKIIKKKFYILGNKRGDLAKSNLQKLFHILNSIIEIKLLNKIDFFSDDFIDNSLKFLSVHQKKKFLESLPRVWGELFLIFIIVIILLVGIISGDNLNELIFSISILFLCSIRILPSIIRLISLNNELSFYKRNTNELVNFIQKKDKKIYKKKNITKWSKIKIKDIDFNFNKLKIFKKVKFVISKKDKILINGPSGSGKSTLLLILIGALNPSSGKITIDEKNINDLHFQNLFSYTPQKTYLLNDTILNNITLNERKENIDFNKLKLACRVCEINNKIFRRKNILKYKVGDNGKFLSGGQTQRISIARALYSNREIMIFDESTSAIDENGEKRIINNLLKYYKSKTIIYSTHRFSNFKKFKKRFLIENSNFSIQHN